jgi:hypothetical protein
MKNNTRAAAAADHPASPAEPFLHFRAGKLAKAL